MKPKDNEGAQIYFVAAEIEALSRARADFGWDAERWHAFRSAQIKLSRTSRRIQSSRTETPLSA